MCIRDRESCVSALIHGQANGRLGAPQPHRAPIAANSPQMAGEAEHIGYAVLGPVFTGFDRWLRAEAEALQQQRGGTVHWLFLMRDGWLPLRVHEAIGADPHAHAVEISRFTSTAASFVNEAVTVSYTHLEVYKRQVQRHVQRGDPVAGAGADGHLGRHRP